MTATICPKCHQPVSYDQQRDHWIECNAHQRHVKDQLAMQSDKDGKMMGSKTIQLHIPIRSDFHAPIILPYPMTRQEWEQMMRVLEAMKPALIAPEKSATNQEHAEHGEDAA